MGPKKAICLFIPTNQILVSILVCPLENSKCRKYVMENVNSANLKAPSSSFLEKFPFTAINVEVAPIIPNLPKFLPKALERANEHYYPPDGRWPTHERRRLNGGNNNDDRKIMSHHINEKCHK
ncbi:hypothetical protein SUGI_0486300 [Cryptomeria japonica]|nr:hypothetical protein SUGI_0486300 [Cryptomeria japonica]